MDRPRDIAVLIPCHNEQQTIGKVIDDFRAQLPAARIVVFDNCCTDETARVAREHGAEVVAVGRLGKGHVVEAMFEHADADICVMVDGDDTYPAEQVGDLIAPVAAGEADMAVGARRAAEGGAFRPLHRAGNRLVCRLVNAVSGSRLSDILSGYRALSRRVLDRVPVVSSGFEIETEMTIQTLYHRMRIVEVEVAYRPRPEGSRSKLRTLRDGTRVVWKIFSLLRSFKPLTFFGSLALVLLVAAGLCLAGPVAQYVGPGRVESLASAVIGMGLLILSGGCVFLGVLLHAMNWRLLEMHSVLTRRRRL